MQTMENISFLGKNSALACCAMRLSDFLKEKLQGRGTQASFARSTKISDGTVSKWAKGEIERAPNFENCLRIAAYFKVEPVHIFEMADRPDYLVLFRTFFPESKKRVGEITAPLDPYQQLWPGCQNPLHPKYHERLEGILHSNAIDEDGTPIYSGIVVNINSHYEATIRRSPPNREAPKEHLRPEDNEKEVVERAILEQAAAARASRPKLRNPGKK